jgi:hypothetical protein
VLSGNFYDANVWATQLTAGCSTSPLTPESEYIFTRALRYSNNLSVPAGTYTVLYDGKGDINFSSMGCDQFADADGIVISVELDSTNGCSNNGINGYNSGNNSRGLGISISNIDSVDPIRNIRIIMPGGICKGSPFTRVDNAAACGTTPYIDFAEVLKANRNAIVFNPDYLNFSKDFRVLRMMNLMEASPRTPGSYTLDPCPEPANPTQAQTDAYNVRLVRRCSFYADPASFYLQDMRRRISASSFNC